MIKATQSPRKNRKNRGNAVYDSAFASGRQNYVIGSAAADGKRSTEAIRTSASLRDGAASR